MGSRERTEQAANAQGAAHRSLFMTWQPLSGYVQALHPRLQMKLNFFFLIFFTGAE